MFQTIAARTSMEPPVAALYDSRLPLHFPSKHLFPAVWPAAKGKKGEYKTPELNSPQWEAIMEFRESALWKDGDLQKFADYFGVTPSAVSFKIKDSLLRRNTPRSLEVLASMKRRKRAGKIKMSIVLTYIILSTRGSPSPLPLGLSPPSGPLQPHRIGKPNPQPRG